MKYTDNIRFNHKLNVFVFIGSFILFSSIQNNIVQNFYKALIFVAIYSFSSAFIQPDLDQTSTRPGKSTFPLGHFKENFIGQKLFPFLYPFNRVWYFFWQPYGSLFTHRGLSHWPIVGTLTRAGYVLLIMLGLRLFLPILNLNPIINYLELYFPTEANLTNFSSFSLFWFIYILPVFLSDVIHFLVDLFDSIRNNTRFQSYAHEPGILKQILNPKIMKFHKRALRKAKSNAKKRK